MATLEFLNKRFERKVSKFTEKYAEDAKIKALMHLIQRIVDYNHLQQKDVEKYS